jgi:hypothetical protein
MTEDKEKKEKLITAYTLLIDQIKETNSNIKLIAINLIIFNVIIFYLIIKTFNFIGNQ